MSHVGKSKTTIKAKSSLCCFYEAARLHNSKECPGQNGIRGYLPNRNVYIRIKNINAHIISFVK
jgi:hypothetical protein